MTDKPKGRKQKTEENTGFSGYRHMLSDYEHAAERLRSRELFLRQELHQCRGNKLCSAESARREMDLLRRLSILSQEYYDLQEVIRSIRPYAEKEVSA